MTLLRYGWRLSAVHLIGALEGRALADPRVPVLYLGGQLTINNLGQLHFLGQVNRIPDGDISDSEPLVAEVLPVLQVIIQQP